MPDETALLPEGLSSVKSFYSTILSQTFSPCGNYLLAGNVYGEVFVFEAVCGIIHLKSKANKSTNLKHILNPEHEVQQTKQRPYLKFVADENGQIRSLVSTEKFLIVGSNGRILGFDWKYIIHGKIPKVAWIINIPPLKDAVEVVEVNAVLITDNLRVYSGCGDNKIHVHSMEDGRLIKSLTGHSDYIHDLALIGKDQLASASEDGTVQIWDCRCSKFVSTLEPNKETSLKRPHLGKWVGSINVEKGWLLCGGGPKPGLWHLGTMQLTTVFDTDDKGVHVAKIHEERVMIGGCSKLNQYTLQGDSICSVPTTCSTIYSLVLQSQSSELMAIAGSSRNIELCTNLHYRDQVLTCI